MRVLVTGAAGMLGRKFCHQLATVAQIGGQTVESLTMADVVEPPAPAGATVPIRLETGDLSQPGVAEGLIADHPELIVHTAAVVSGEAEADLEKGYRINLIGSQYLFDAVRRAEFHPRLIFTSSIAVFGTPFPEKIGDEFLCAPLTSYGAQKAMAELILADYTRRGFFDGIGIRLPTICVRPGKPNLAASGFFSNIIREPLNGQTAILPVAETVRHWFASPRAATGFLFRAAEIETAKIGPRRNLTMPGLSVTIGEMIASLRRVAGEGPVRLIQREPDPVIMRIVDGWAQNFDPIRARNLGFVAETNFDEIIRAHIEDEGISR
jgi:D-erythronate 2-dehydrogenase